MSGSEDMMPSPAPPAQIDLPDEGHPRRRKHRRRHSGPFRRVRRFLRRLRLRQHLPRLLAVLVVVALVIGVSGLVVATDATSRVQTSFNRLRQVLTTTTSQPGATLTLDDFSLVRSSLTNLVTTLADVQRQANLIRPLLTLNPDLKTTLTYQDAALQLALSADAMLDGLEPTLFLLVGQDTSMGITTQIPSGQRVVDLLRLGLPRLLNAQTNLQSAKADLDGIDRSSLSAGLLLQLEQLENYYEQLNNIQNVLLVAPDLLTLALGLDTPQTYLVLSQNSDELRPSGGFVSTYGWLTVRNGRVENYDYSPSTAGSPNPPSAALADQIHIPDWWLSYKRPIYAAWDGSWTPNFPDTAQRAMWYYNSGNNPQAPVRGVIAIDLVAFEHLLEALGQVTVTEDGRTVTVTPDNFRNVIYEIRAFGEGDEPHKRFLAATYRQIFADWQATASDPTKSAAILGAVVQSLREKHVMLYFDDAQMNSALDLLGWSGRQAAAAAGADYLMVVDANLGNKSNSSITRQTTYDVDLSPDQSATSRLTVTYDYPASVASQDPAVNPEFHGPLTYNNLLAIYTPLQTALGSSKGDYLNLKTDADPDHTLFTSVVSVPFDGSESYQLSYRLPAVVETVSGYQRYRLVIQKQPGMRAELVNVQVSLPPGAALVSATPEAVASYNIEREILEFQVELVSDTTIDVVYQLQ
jgi:Protein of unknown function (DUF4012)